MFQCNACGCRAWGWQIMGVANSDLPQHPEDASKTAPLSLPIRRLAAHVSSNSEIGSPCFFQFGDWQPNAKVMLAANHGGGKLRFATASGGCF
ncbi:MAG: hypothetical protein PHH43_01085, partial [Candidatus Cloacimonetes bacterium]|nr:hypothetical protein [Candidatus Cloacimonadota bacterium]